MGDPSFSRQNTFEAARDDTFFKLTTLTRLVKGQPANEDALVELTGSLLAVQTYRELKPYNLILQQLPVSWPDCAVQPAMLDLVIKQFVAFSTKKSERKRIIADDSLADGRGQYEVDQYGRVTAALKALDEALRPSDFFPLTAPASPCDKDIISGLIWKPPLVASTSRETALEDYSKVSPSPEPGEDVVGLYEQCVRPSESNLNALLTSPPYSPQREEIQWQTVQDSTFAAQNKDMTIYDSEPSRFETSRRRAQIRENTARTRKSRATMPAHAPAANVQTKNALFYIYRTSSQTKLNWMSDCEDDVSPLHSSSKSPYVPHDLNPPSEAPSYSTSLKHETSNGAHAFAYANVSDAPHMLSVPLLSSGLPSTDQSKASSPSAARYEKTQHEKEQLQRGFTSSSLSSDKEHLDDSSLLSCPSNKTPSCRAVDVVVVIEDDHSLTSDVSNLMPAAHATPFRISSSPSTAEVRSPSRSLLPRGKPGSPASQDSKEV